MPNKLQKYFDLGLDQLSTVEKYNIGCKLLESACPDFRPLPDPIPEQLMGMIRKAEMIIKQNQNPDLDPALDLLGDALDLLSDLIID